ncbi:conserved hypothetical protein [Paenarthrobacter aurescens TC1]|uniref:Uncharacterized protein n=1 Tax=Paenarthrobacter aurescens (strain TC1) TaxID=290340 RepID=A1R293_PAEAT|nr:conserved hypothetical protein [Paenarthrobacter aurescens TC1]
MVLRNADRGAGGPSPPPSDRLPSRSSRTPAEPTTASTGSPNSAIPGCSVLVTSSVQPRTATSGRVAVITTAPSPGVHVTATGCLAGPHRFTARETALRRRGTPSEVVLQPIDTVVKRERRSTWAR